MSEELDGLRGYQSRKFSSIHSKAGAPTTTEVPAGETGIWKDTNDGSIKMWVNDNGTLKSLTFA